MLWKNFFLNKLKKRSFYGLRDIVKYDREGMVIEIRCFVVGGERRGLFISCKNI